MFLWSPRDPFGVKISITVTLAWIAWFLFCHYIDWRWVEIVAFVLAVLVTVRASVLLCRHRDVLAFKNDFGRQHAFPSDQGRERAVFTMHFAAFILFFVWTVAFILSGRDVSEHTSPLVLLGGLLMGLPGFVGLVQHFVRRAHTRQAASRLP